MTVRVLCFVLVLIATAKIVFDGRVAHDPIEGVSRIGAQGIKAAFELLER
jgi:hypothetical protein